MSGTPGAEYLDLTVRQLLDAFAAPGPDPGGGAAAALTAALAAGLCAMSARVSARSLASAPEIAEEAERLRGRAAPLAQADVEGYQAVMTAMQSPGADGGSRRQRLAEALSEASRVPMEVTEIAARVSELAAAVAEGGSPSVRGDAVAAAVLAAAAARSASELVRINLRETADDRPGRAGRLADGAARSAEQARLRIGQR